MLIRVTPLLRECVNSLKPLPLTCQLVRTFCLQWIHSTILKKSVWWKELSCHRSNKSAMFPWFFCSQPVISLKMFFFLSGSSIVFYAVNAVKAKKWLILHSEWYTVSLRWALSNLIWLHTKWGSEMGRWQWQLFLSHTLEVKTVTPDQQPQLCKYIHTRMHIELKYCQTFPGYFAIAAILTLPSSLAIVWKKQIIM